MKDETLLNDIQEWGEFLGRLGPLLADLVKCEGPSLPKLSLAVVGLGLAGIPERIGELLARINKEVANDT